MNPEPGNSYHLSRGPNRPKSAALQFRYQRRFRRKSFTTIRGSSCRSCSCSSSSSSSFLLLLNCCWSKKSNSNSEEILATLSSPIIVLLFALLLVSSLVNQLASSQSVSSSNLVAPPVSNRNSGQFSVTQLCATKSAIPSSKRIEGAVLWSKEDTEVNCTITFRTKSSQQHFVIHFEELKLGCDDHLKLFDADFDYGQPPFAHFSCSNNLASVPKMKTVGSHLTIRLQLDHKSIPGDGFRLVLSSVYDYPRWDCPLDYGLCANNLCISRSLFCDQVNHCTDNSDELNCPATSGTADPNSGSATGSDSSASGDLFGSLLSGTLTLTNALGLLVVLVLIIFTCVILFIATIYCRRETHYAQYQRHLQRSFAGAALPLHTSSSVMFPGHQPTGAPAGEYHYFQPANMSPYITPTHQHHLATLPRGYSTLPLNLGPRPAIGGLQPQQQQQHLHQPPPISSSSMATGKLANSVVAATPFGVPPNAEYLMMAGLAPHTGASQGLQAAPSIQTSLYLPTCQSILVEAPRCPPPPHQQTTNMKPPQASPQHPQRL